MATLFGDGVLEEKLIFKYVLRHIVFKFYFVFVLFDKRTGSHLLTMTRLVEMGLLKVCTKIKIKNSFPYESYANSVKRPLIYP